MAVCGSEVPSSQDWKLSCLLLAITKIAVKCPEIRFMR